MFVIAGLGNPGRQYEGTRHNIGFECVDYISLFYNIPFRKLKFQSVLGEGFIQDEKVLLVKPQTYMNNSGEALRDIVEFYRLDLSRLIVIYDDVDLDFGTIRIRHPGKRRHP